MNEITSPESEPDSTADWTTKTACAIDRAQLAGRVAADIIARSTAKGTSEMTSLDYLEIALCEMDRRLGLHDEDYM